MKKWYISVISQTSSVNYNEFHSIFWCLPDDSFKLHPFFSSLSLKWASWLRKKSLGALSFGVDARVTQSNNLSTRRDPWPHPQPPQKPRASLIRLSFQVTLDLLKKTVLFFPLHYVLCTPLCTSLSNKPLYISNKPLQAVCVECVCVCVCVCVYSSVSISKSNVE